jgi:hypothetical protein
MGSPLTSHAAPGQAAGELDRTTPSGSVLLGQYSPGAVNVKGDQVYFFALTYRGNLAPANAQQAWINGFHKALDANLSLHAPGSTIIGRTSDRQHFLIGFWDKTAGHGGWLAGDSQTVNGVFARMRWFAGNPGEFASGSFDLVARPNFVTNGASFQLQVGALDAGRVSASFTTPS